MRPLRGRYAVVTRPLELYAIGPVTRAIFHEKLIVVVDARKFYFKLSFYSPVRPGKIPKQTPAIQLIFPLLAAGAPRLTT